MSNGKINKFVVDGYNPLASNVGVADFVGEIEVIFLNENIRK